MQDYIQFLESKTRKHIESGFTVSPEDLPKSMFQFQRDITIWALKKGKSAIFAGTGLGKTILSLAWADQVVKHTSGKVLIIAPLAVASQTVHEGEKFGISVTLCRKQEDVKPGINITNYEMLEHFNPAEFSGIVLDESGILKNYSGKMRNQIIDAFKDTPYKLCCTATPAPNDHMELGNHSEFLGVMNRTEMLSTYFVHDGGDTSQWRLKGHAVKDFWTWVSSWAVMLQNPRDLGYEGELFDLPPLNIQKSVVEPKTSRFVGTAKTLTDRREARRESIEERVKVIADLVNNSDETWLVWCDLNLESEALKRSIPDSVEVRGSDSPEYKEKASNNFCDGKTRVLVSKPSIFGMGLNYQHCHNMVFTGLSDSFEQYFQAVRRCWRFGQDKQVNVYVVTAKAEGAVVANIKRKEQQFNEMLTGMIAATQELSIENVRGSRRDRMEYKTNTEQGALWTMRLGDNVERIKEIENDSVGYVLYSPPFASLYTYSNSERDMGNCGDDEEFFTHFGFLAKELYRVLQSGRNMSIHCMDLPKSKERDGVIGLRDFSGLIIRLMEDIGFIYHSKVTIWKDPVIAMQRTKALGLLWKQLKKDSVMSRQGIPDYVITFRKPGENLNPIDHDALEYPVAKWQQIASPIWMDINPSCTLQKESAREDEDERHVCPLQLEVIDRCLDLWSKPNDIVLDPFAGIGSVPHQAIKKGRIGIGIELKESYYQQAVDNCKKAEHDARIPQSNLETWGIAKEKQLVLSV